MKLCLSCLRPFPTRWDRIALSVVLVAVLVIGGSVGYLVRDSVFLKRENGVLWKLVNVYVGRVEVDKLVDVNTALRAKGRVQPGQGGR